MGDRELGSKVLDNLMFSAEQMNVPVVRFVRELLQRREMGPNTDFLLEEIFPWLLAIVYLMSAKQAVRASFGRLNNQYTLDWCSLQLGECWRDAFGELWVVDLSEEFNAFKDIGSNIAINYPMSSIENYISQNQADIGVSEIVVCELQDLMLCLDCNTYVEVP